MIKPLKADDILKEYVAKDKVQAHQSLSSEAFDRMPVLSDPAESSRPSQADSHGTDEDESWIQLTWYKKYLH